MVRQIFCSRRRKLQILFDVLWAINLLGVYGFMLIKVRPHRRGFFCDDVTIRYPYQDDTVKDWLLIVFSVVITPLLFAVIESVTSWQAARHFSLPRIRLAASSSITLFGYFWFGLMTTLIVTEVGKLSIGRLRPHFIDVCRPEFGANSTCSFDVGLTYIEDYSCSKEGNPRLLYDARKSFPSGHSSLAAYAAVYLGYYFHRRLSSQSTLLLKLVLQMVLCCLALFTALSRVTDNKHHWSDVTVGALIGVLVGAWMILFIRKTVRWGIHAITSDVESGGIVLVTPTDQTQQQPAPVVMVTADDIHSNTTKQIDEPMKLALCQPVTYGHVDHNDQLSLRVAAGMSRGD